jgi:hypothetical protein
MPRDLGAHVGEAAAVRDVGVGHVDVDRGRDVLDQHPQACRRLDRLAARALERRSGVPQASQQREAGRDDDAERDGRERDRRPDELGNAGGDRRDRQHRPGTGRHRTARWH